MQKPISTATTTESVTADPRLRRDLILVVVLLALLGVVYFVYLSAEIDSLRAAEEPDPSGLLRQLYWMGVGLVAAVAAFFIYLVIVAARVFSSGQFPPPGARVLRDTPIWRGARARLLALAGVALGLLALLAAFYAHHFIGAFVGTVFTL